MKNRSVLHRTRLRSKKKFGRIIVVTGARQTGKTTMVRKAFPDYKYLSIEDPVLRKTYAQLTADQWNTNYPKAILDEVQKEPLLIESIKSVYDQFEEPRYILLGSSQILLLEKVRESLAGRSQIVEMFPLTLPEQLTGNWDDEVQASKMQMYLEGKFDLNNLLPSFKLAKGYAKIQNVYNSYLAFGGYPALTDNNLTDDERYEWLFNYVKTYLERDIRDLAELRNLEPFIKIQQMVALNTGNLVNFTKLANEAGVTSKTAQRYLQYLEISYQAISLMPWHKNTNKRLVKSSKIHFLDPGILNAVLNKRSMMSGNEFESAIIAEIYKQIKNAQLPINMYHLRTQDGREIDLLLELENGYIPIEIKMSTHISTSDARHIYDLNDILDKPILHSFILSNDPNVKKISDKITAIHAAMFLT